MADTEQLTRADAASSDTLSSLSFPHSGIAMLGLHGHIYGARIQAAQLCAIYLRGTRSACSAAPYKAALAASIYTLALP